MMHGARARARIAVLKYNEEGREREMTVRRDDTPQRYIKGDDVKHGQSAVNRYSGLRRIIT